LIPVLRIHLLGDFLLTLDDVPVMTINSPRLQSLFAYLVLHQKAPQNRSHVAFLMWPDSAETQAYTNLRQLLYHLRQALPYADRFLHIDNQCLQWLPTSGDGTFTLDIQEMEQALLQAEQAEQAQDTNALRLALEQVLHLYHGDLLPGCYDEWILPERDRLRQTFLRATQRLSTLAEEARDYGAAITIAQQLQRADPLDEATCRQLMRLYALSGERAAALRIYHTFSKLLERELGAQPARATQTVYEGLVRSNESPEVKSNPRTLRRTDAPLISRKAEWRLLQDVWRKVTNGKAQMAILTGEAGIGKTRLVEEMEVWASRQGITIASARCYSTLEDLAYAPVTIWLRSEALHSVLSDLDSTWLTEIARLVPEVLATRPNLPRPTAMTEGWQRQHFFEALARAILSARQPLLLLLDDLHWCDHETLAWLQYLFRFAPEAHVLLLGTVRAEETSPTHPLVAFLQPLQRDSLVTEIALGPLTPIETTILAEHVSGQRFESAIANRLYSETEGNPLFVVEMMRAGAAAEYRTELHVLDEGLLFRSEDPLDRSSIVRPERQQGLSLFARSASTLPPMIQIVLATRLAQLSPLAHEVASVAAVIGREFTFSVLVQASGQNEEAVVRGLDELWQKRIVREQGQDKALAYDFSHDKLREQVYTSLSPASRCLLHRRTAEAFQAVYKEDLDGVSGQVAAHYERAGLPEHAIPFYQRAGEVARRIYANVDAVNAFEHAIALLKADIPGQTQWASWDIKAEVYESLGEVFTEMGRYQEASQAYNQAILCLPDHEYLRHARLQRKTAIAWNHAATNPYDILPVNIRQAFQEAERILLRISNPADLAWRQEWIELQFAQIWPPRWSADEMTEAIEKARPIVAEYGTQDQQDFLAYALSTRDMIRDRYVITVSEEKIAFRRAAIVVIQQSGNKSKLGFYQIALSTGLLWSGRLAEAEEQFKQALQLGEEINSAWLQTRCLTFLPFIYRKRGEVEQVREVLAHAHAIGAARNNRLLLGQRAWVAWRDGNLNEAEIYGRQSVEAVKHQPMETNPFQWVGLWPLIGVAMTQEKIDIAMGYVRMLLDITQQPPSKEIETLLEMALQAWELGQQDKAYNLLQQATSLAKQTGYL
jgi:predicted ATPase